MPSSKLFQPHFATRLDWRQRFSVISTGRKSIVRQAPGNGDGESHFGIDTHLTTCRNCTVPYISQLRGIVWCVSVLNITCELVLCSEVCWGRRGHYSSLQGSWCDWHWAGQTAVSCDSTANRLLYLSLSRSLRPVILKIFNFNRYHDRLEFLVRM